MIGDYNTTETVHLPFNTFSSNDPSASVTITNLVAGDIHIHKDGGVTQRSSSAGVTISIDFDGITGNHMAHIDLSDNTDAGFYAVGSTFQVRIEGTTVDAGTINAWIGTFSIGRTLRPTTDGRTLDVTATGAAGIDWGNVENKTTVNDLTQTDIQLVDTVTTYTGNTKQTADHTAGIADIPTVAEFEARTIVSADYVVVADTIAGVTNAGTVTGNVDGNVGGDVQGNVDGSVASVTADVVTDAASRTASKADVSGLGTSAELAKVPKSDSNVTFNATALASINAECDTAISDAGLPEGIVKNATFSNFEFLMVDATDGFTPETGLTVTGQRSIDAGAFANVTGAIAEIGSGIYQFDAAAADTNGDLITWKFASAGAADRFFTFKTTS